MNHTSADQLSAPKPQCLPAPQTRAHELEHIRAPRMCTPSAYRVCHGFVCFRTSGAARAGHSSSSPPTTLHSFPARKHHTLSHRTPPDTTARTATAAYAVFLIAFHIVSACCLGTVKRSVRSLRRTFESSAASPQQVRSIYGPGLPGPLLSCAAARAGRYDCAPSESSLRRHAWPRAAALLAPMHSYVACDRIEAIVTQQNAASAMLSGH